MCYWQTEDDNTPACVTAENVCVTCRLEVVTVCVPALSVLWHLCPQGSQLGSGMLWMWPCCYSRGFLAARAYECVSPAESRGVWIPGISVCVCVVDLFIFSMCVASGVKVSEPHKTYCKYLQVQRFKYPSHHNRF